MITKHHSWNLNYLNEIYWIWKFTLKTENKSKIPMYITLKRLNKSINVKTELMQIKKQKKNDTFNQV